MKVVKHQACLAVLISVALSSLGCSVAEEKRQLYRQSQIIEPLKIPAGLQQPRGDNMLSVPQVVASEPIDVSPPVNLPEELLPTPKNIDQDEDQVE